MTQTDATSPTTEAPIITQMRAIVDTAATTGDWRPLEQGLIALFNNVDQALQNTLKDAARFPQKTDLLMANARAFQAGLEAMAAMDRAIEANDVPALRKGFTRLAQASARVLPDVPPATPPVSPTEGTLQRLTARFIKRSEDLAAAQPDAALQTVALAETVARADASRAHELCLKAMSMASDNPEVRSRIRRQLSNLVPGYHLPMMNDTRRNETWNKVLSRLIQPGMKVLEIGTGAGMLTLMAARAGAHVTTCEYHPLVAEVARAIIARNGLSDRVTVLTKGSLDMQVGVDLEEPADLLFCDNFSDNMLDFEPLKSISDARARLLKPDAPCVPAGGQVYVALAHWRHYERFFTADQSVGFDISPALEFRPDSIDMEIADPGFRLRSPGQLLFSFDFSQSTFPPFERRELLLEADGDGPVNGVAQWIRLQLDADTWLESKPDPNMVFFSNPRLHALEQSLDMKQGQTLRVAAQHDSRSVAIWTDGAAALSGAC